MMRAATLAFCLLLMAAGAGARPLDQLYDDATLAYWQARYPSGVVFNLREVIWPVLTAAERGRLEDVRLRFPTKIEGAEPLAFFARGDVITLSVASIKLLNDLAIASAWLHHNGYQLTTVYEYVHWLRYGAAQADGKLVPPLEALCIPDDALDDPEVDQFAQELLKGQIFFILGHELAHVHYGHPGYQGIFSAEARANEAAADAFAMDLFARIGEPPLAMSHFFMIMAHAELSRGDYASEQAWRAAVSRRTHPVSEARLAEIAAHLRAHAARYPPRTADAIAELELIAETLADPEMQLFTSQRGREVTLVSLAPRRPHQTLGQPCAGTLPTAPFAGTLRGTLFIAGVDFTVDLQLQREGERVIGSFDYGAGPGALEGIVVDGVLTYRWQHADDWGTGRLERVPGSGYVGTWGYGQDTTGGGSWEVR